MIGPSSHSKKPLQRDCGGSGVGSGTGSGMLTINGNYKHAVVSKVDLVVIAKNLKVNAVNVGLFG